MPASYKRATAPLDAKARARLSSSTPAPPSPSSLSPPDNSPELADLVDSFYDHDDEPNSPLQWSSTENDSLGIYRLCKQKLEKMISESRCDSAAQRVAGVAGAAGLVESKRELVARLRDKDFDAGICITSWNRAPRLTAGSYEYIDVILTDRSRYIVAVDLAKEFEIVRPKPHYQSILQSLPEIFVVKAEILKKVVRILCAVAKESIRSNGMHIPPWRRWEYVEAKWFSPYKRIENGKAAANRAGKGEVAVQEQSFRRRRGFCRVEVKDEGRRAHGELAMAVKRNVILYIEREKS